MTNRPLAILAVIILSILMMLYVYEFSVFSNTLEMKRLVLISTLAGAVLATVPLWIWRARFMPWKEHFSTAVLILTFSIVFAPLFGSLLNRGLGTDGTDSFEFVAETAYFASGYGVLKGEKLKPTGWKLILKEAEHQWRLSYKTQAFFPLTKPGEKVLLPVRKGVLGVRVVGLK
ncbi:MAG: hypothetical protein H7246_18240 [Phycisphaerae bacterium]|nr:hypothetical protein [Saprospiraceae bacterium]